MLWEGEKMLWFNFMLIQLLCCLFEEVQIPHDPDYLPQEYACCFHQGIFGNISVCMVVLESNP